MKKIIFGITSLTLGGAERVLVDLVNKLCSDYDITIFTIYPKGFKQSCIRIIFINFGIKTLVVQNNTREQNKKNPIFGNGIKSLGSSFITKHPNQNRHTDGSN